jgi:membrane protease YdiL (CAAX protease family)
MSMTEVRTSTSRPVRTGRRWVVLAGVEAVLGAVAVIADLAIPTLVMLLLAGAGLALRREWLGSLGLHRTRALPLAGRMLAFAVVWSLFQLSVTMPVANHASAQEQDLEAFADLQGNVTMLLGLLALSWTLAAFGEELAYRGWLMTRIRQALGDGRISLVVAVLLSSLLFGLAHTEQGAIGVLVVSLDGVAFAVLRLHYGTLWAPVLAHGFNNTLGFLAFFLLGPVHAFW